jgi:hypothetical protein
MCLDEFQQVLAKVTVCWQKGVCWASVRLLVRPSCKEVMRNGRCALLFGRILQLDKKQKCIGYRQCMTGAAETSTRWQTKGPHPHPKSLLTVKRSLLNTLASCFTGPNFTICGLMPTKSQKHMLTNTKVNNIYTNFYNNKQA